MKERNHQSLEPLMFPQVQVPSRTLSSYYSSQPVSSVVHLTGSWASSRRAQRKEHVLWSLSPLLLSSVADLVRHTISLIVSQHCPGDPMCCPLPTGQRGGAQHAVTKVSQTCSLWASTALCGESRCLVHRLPL